MPVALHVAALAADDEHHEGLVRSDFERLLDIPGTLCSPSGRLDTRSVMHPFTHIRLTDTGIQWLADYVAKVRSVGFHLKLAPCQ